jgi:3-keto-5-aminohexanoate cleavage enzyme
MVEDRYASYRSRKLILTVAVTGSTTSKGDNPNHPEQPEEIVDDVVACEEAGASIAHIHARGADGVRTKDPRVFQEIMDGIVERCDDILVNFTSAGRGFTRAERLKPILETEPRPDLASLDMGPFNRRESTVEHPRSELAEFAERFREAGVKPEPELFNPGQITEVQYLIEEGLIEAPYFCQLLFGYQSGTLPHPKNLINVVENLPDGSLWSTIGIGRHQLPLTTMTVPLGGHVRVGLEDNVYYRTGELAESNAQLVERAATMARALERPIATPAEAREMLGL